MRYSVSNITGGRGCLRVGAPADPGSRAVSEGLLALAWVPCGALLCTLFWRPGCSAAPTGAIVMELLEGLAWVAQWAPVLYCYPVAVLAWRLSTREVTLGGVGCDTLLLCLLVLSAVGAAVTAANEFGSIAGGALKLQVLSLVSAFAACARTFQRHIRGPRFRPVDMGGKLCVVTGANTGIGLETTRELVRMGATVVMGCRSASRAKVAADDVIASTGCRPDQVPFIRALDLSSLRSVKEFSEEFAERYGDAAKERHGLDVLICNAGLMQPHRVLTEDGIELTMAANHFGHFLLIQQLLPHLERSSTGGRIVNVGSALAHNASAFAIDDVMRCAALSF
eukprot:COSAG02_NODE_6818_length_3344_cov_12.386133_6_plen_338_part_00